ncbi:MAG TPA: multiheme c-type cytochrome [Anaerolineales bacterium]|nr:multiheme c-type cytochrome [Anaerolineales bacterium]
MKRLIALGSALLLLAIVAAWWANSRQPKPIVLIPTLTGKPEYCLTCHSDLPEISKSHPIKTFGCVICHGGEALALNADLAHSTMRGGANPSDLSVVQESCGGSSCHSGTAEQNNNHIQRVLTSVQATYAGAITNILYTYGAEGDLTARFGIRAVADAQVTTSTGVPALQAFDPAGASNPAIQKFAVNCLFCHLNAQPLPGPQFDRLSGCAACHTPGIGSLPPGQIHKLTTAIPYTQCNTCHNRGNYDLRAMAFVPRSDQPQAADRVQNYYQPIAQFTKCEYELDCIDCHTRTEAMGDGDIHSNETQIQYIQCRTCHGTPTQLPSTKMLTDPNDIAFRQAQLNPVVDLELGQTVIVTDKGEPMWNTRVLPDGTYQLVGKATGQVFTFRPVMGSGCTQNGIDQSSAYCHTCHAVQR